MLNINFVPDDYVQKRESMRTNLICLVLFLIVMASLGGVFMVLKMRQRAVSAQSTVIAAKMEQAQKDIAQLEELQTKRKEMMKAALTTAELVEPMPRTVILAELTNCLPAGASLRTVKLSEAKVQTAVPAAKPSTFDQAKAGAQNNTPAKSSAPKAKPEPAVKTELVIEGIAPSDLQVASYIAQLNNSVLLDDVELVLSKEYQKDDMLFREFKLQAVLKKDRRLTQKDIEEIRTKRQSLL